MQYPDTKTGPLKINFFNSTLQYANKQCTNLFNTKTPLYILGKLFLSFYESNARMTSAKLNKVVNVA